MRNIYDECAECSTKLLEHRLKNIRSLFSIKAMSDDWINAISQLSIVKFIYNSIYYILVCGSFDIAKMFFARFKRSTEQRKRLKRPLALTELHITHKVFKK